MNIFVLHNRPEIAATMLCDEHVTKMAVESAQMLAAAVLRHGAKPSDMPLTKKGTPYRGGYRFHPCTVWAGDTRTNFLWLYRHGVAICNQYHRRYGKFHACSFAIRQIGTMANLIPSGPLTPHPQCMPEHLQIPDRPVHAYRQFYRTKAFATWFRAPIRHNGRRTPYWWRTIVSESHVLDWNELNDARTERGKKFDSSEIIHHCPPFGLTDRAFYEVEENYIG